MPGESLASQESAPILEVCSAQALCNARLSEKNAKSLPPDLLETTKYDR
jgi:hypothetical protein